MGPAYAAFSELKVNRDRQEEKRQQEEIDAVETPSSTEVRGNSGREDNDSARGADSKESTDEPIGSSGGNATASARLKLISWYAGRESSALAKELYGNEVGQHATPDEVRMCPAEEIIFRFSLSRCNLIMNVFVFTRYQEAYGGNALMSPLYFVDS